MPRINFEDDVETKQEFWNLLQLIGNDRDAALGKLVRFFRLAQKAFAEDRPVTEIELNSAGLECMTKSGWAIPVEGGYRCKGEQEHFAWYRQRLDCARAGGLARANAPRDDKGRYLNSRIPSEPQPEASRSQPESSALPLPPAPPLSLVKKQNTYSVGRNGKTVSPPDPSGIGRFVGAFVKAYQTKYKARPYLGGKVQGQIKNFLKETPVDQAIALVQVYLQMEDPWFQKKKHDFTTFTENINSVSLAFQTGKDPSQAKSDYSFLQEASQ